MKLSKQILIALGITGAGVLSAEHLTREQIDKMLETLFLKERPKTFSFGAMCYAGGPRYMAITYDCPKCQTKTYHPGYRIEGRGTYRQHIDRLKELGLDVTWDESCLCSQCCKDKNVDKAGVYFEVRIGESVKRTRLDIDDVFKLTAFLEGKEFWSDGKVDNRLLRHQINRIGEILGIEDSDTLSDRLWEKTKEQLVERWLKENEKRLQAAKAKEQAPAQPLKQKTDHELKDEKKGQ